jgi:hypothetical protein
MKNLQNLKGAKALNKKEQQTINGGGPISAHNTGCNPGCLSGETCVAVYDDQNGNIIHYTCVQRIGNK